VCPKLPLKRCACINEVAINGERQVRFRGIKGKRSWSQEKNILEFSGMFFAAQLRFFQEKLFLDNSKKIICIKTNSLLNPKTAKI